jgi:hypothetical protein
MYMRAALVLVPAALVAVLASVALAGGGKNEVSALREATDPYHDIEVARDSGYVTELPQTAEYGGGTCVVDISVPSAGAMGIHLVDTRPGGRLDGVLEPTNPEALLYEKRKDGSYRLTGVEFIVAGGERPKLFGNRFDDTNLARYGDPNTNVWTLHAWIWKPNPNGMFDPWNTRVNCR